MNIDVLSSNFGNEFKKKCARRMRTPSNTQHRHQTIISMDKRQVDDNYKIVRTKSMTRKNAGMVVPSTRTSHIRLSKPTFPLGVTRDCESQVQKLKMAAKKKTRQHHKIDQITSEQPPQWQDQPQVNVRYTPQLEIPPHRFASPYSNESLQSAFSREKLASLENAVANMPSQLRIECARAQRQAEDSQIPVKQLVQGSGGARFSYQDTLRAAGYKLQNQVDSERVQELLQKRAVKRLHAYYNDRACLEYKITDETQKLSKDIADFKASLRVDEPKPPMIPAGNDDLKVVDKTQSFRDDDQDTAVKVDLEDKNDESVDMLKKTKSKKKKGGGKGKGKGVKKKGTESQAEELLKQEAAAKERKIREKLLRNKANLYPEPTSKIFGLDSLKGIRPKSASLTRKKPNIRYNRLPPQLITPFNDTSAKFLRKDKLEPNDLMRKLATKSRQGGISRQRGAKAMGHQTNNVTTLEELQRLQEKNMQSLHSRQELRWDRQIQAINRKRGQSVTPSLIAQQHKEHIGRSQAKKIEMTLSQLVDKADKEEDEERNVTVESLDNEQRPQGVKKLDLRKLNQDLIIGQGLKRNPIYKSRSASKLKRSKSENNLKPREAYRHDVNRQYEGKIEGLGQDRLSRAAVKDYKTVQKLKKQEITGLNAIRKVQVTGYKAPPSIGGTDSLFDRFPVKKRKPAALQVVESSSQPVCLSEGDEVRATIDTKFVNNLKHIKKTVLYNIEDIRECLEQLTEDEEEIDNQSTDAKDIWDIKRDIRIFFKREKLAKPSYMSFGYAATLFNYKVGRVLGRGAYGKVNLAFHKLTKKLCAVKSINKSFIKQMSAMMKLENEIFLLRYLRHPSIIKMFEAVDTTEKPPKGSSKTKEALEEKNLNYHLFFMELCQGGDLLHYVRRRKTLDESTAKYIMYELLKGVGYIHSRRICHRDIKLENILLDNLGRIKLCDFGISKLCKEDEDPDNPKDLPMTQACGTPVYMAPEVIRCDEKFMEREKRGKFKEKDPMKKEERKEEEGEEGYEFECDIWSCGIVLYALLYGDFPFKGVGVRDIKLAVLDGTLSLKKSISPQAQDLLTQMLNKDKTKRISLQQIFKHGWLRGQQKPERIFNQTERELISSEFIFMPDETEKDQGSGKLFSISGGPKKNQIVRAPSMNEPGFIPMKSELFAFTYHNLCSTGGSGQANVTGRSDVLAPFNSSCCAQDERDLVEFREMQNLCKMFQFKDEIMVFDPKAKIYDIKYENDYNACQDNGVLLESCDGEPHNHNKTPDPEPAGGNRNMLGGQSRGQTTDSDKGPKIIQKRNKKNEFEGLIMVESFRPDWKSPREQELGHCKKEEYDMFHPQFPIKPEIVLELVKIGFTLDHVIESLANNHANHCSATYYLYDMDQNSIR